MEPLYPNGPLGKKGERRGEVKIKHDSGAVCWDPGDS